MFLACRKYEWGGGGRVGRKYNKVRIEITVLTITVYYYYYFIYYCVRGNRPERLVGTKGVYSYSIILAERGLRNELNV